MYLTEDNIFTSRQATRHVCVALKKYLEVHLTVKANQVRRTHLRNEGGSPLNELPPYKVIFAVVAIHNELSIFSQQGNL